MAKAKVKKSTPKKRRAKARKFSAVMALKVALALFIGRVVVAVVDVPMLSEAGAAFALMSMVGSTKAEKMFLLEVAAGHQLFELAEGFGALDAVVGLLPG